MSGGQEDVGPPSIESWNRHLMDQIHQNIESASTGQQGNCRVFRQDDSGVLMTIRGVTEKPGWTVVFGPASFAACNAYVNEHGMPDIGKPAKKPEPKDE